MNQPVAGLEEDVGEVVDSGKLSQLQLEGILYACTKHLSWLPSGERCGFFIGDGAGVGKGRQVSGIILDNYVRGRRKHVWVSTSTDLYQDALRDLRDLGSHIPVHNNVQSLDKVTNTPQDGVMFMTYSTLVSSLRGRSRLQQLADWLGGPGFEGCIVLDECHKAKNFSIKESQSTKVATCVLELQRMLPRARVVYCSATGVSEVGNMAYMTRLGLWGTGSAFPDFEAFLDSMKKRGVSFMEMLAMELKGDGLYVARGLSFREAEFSELECRLTSQQVAMYDGAVRLWQDLRGALAAAQAATGGSQDPWKPYWAAQQRFFKLLCVSLKIPVVVKEAKAALEAGLAVVVGLQSTGEAAADSLGLEPGAACGWVSTTREILTQLVTNHFPTHKAEVVEGASQQPGAATPGQPPAERQVQVEACLNLKQGLLQRISKLALPPNFLDQLIDELGGPKQVAEMTGRKARVARDARGRPAYELRAKPDSSDMDSLNIKEKQAFMEGKKLVAIVSDAASTGISLHASAVAANQRRRVHITIELPWSADKAIQQLGRSHRSNQVSSPLYKLAFTNVGGERRFAAAVARRLQSLGALTRGDRRAASGLDLSELNFDSPLGRKSLKRMYDFLVLDNPQLPKGVRLQAVLEGIPEEELEGILPQLPEGGRLNAAQLVEAVQRLHGRLRECVDVMGVGLDLPRADTVAEEGAAVLAGAGLGAGTGSSNKKGGDVRRFLNRLLGLPVARQNLLFNYFQATLSSEIRAAKAEGKYFEGVSDLPGQRVQRKGEPVVLWTDPLTELRTLQHNIEIDRGMSFEAAAARLEHERQGPKDRSGFRLSRRPMPGSGRHGVLLALRKPGAPGMFTICRPNTGPSFFDMDLDELHQKYTPCSPEDAREGWEELFTSSLAHCMHGPHCSVGAGCQVGRRLTEVVILSGSVVRIWDVLERVLAKHEMELSKPDRTMRIVRVEPGDGGRPIIGVRYPAQLLDEVQAMLLSQQEQQRLQLAASGSLLLTTAAAPAAAAGGAGVVVVKEEPPTPVVPSLLKKAYSAPKTVLDFFKKMPPAAPALGAQTSAVATNAAATNGTKAAAATVGSKRPAVPAPAAALASQPTKRQAAAQRLSANQVAACKASGSSVIASVGKAAATPLARNGSLGAGAEVVDLADMDMIEDGTAVPAPPAAAAAAASLTAGAMLAAAVAAEAGARERGGVLQEASQNLSGGGGPLSGRSCAKGGRLGSGGSSGSGGREKDSAASSLAALTGMGFSAAQAESALKANQGNLERAANWLLSRP
ncbi:hypothetical protein N2152v2_004760 [Parachlorella kessleri]